MIRGVLLDVGGVVYVGDRPLPGAVAAIERLRAAGLGLRFVTNTTSVPRRLLLGRLARLGVPAEADELLMPALAARRFLEEEGLVPHLLVAPALEEDFAGLPGGEPDAVVVGDARHGFTYDALNRCFRLIDGGAELLALARNRSYLDADGALSLDTGAFVAALEYASGRAARLFGKPAAGFFLAGVASLGLKPEEVVMIGDDAEADVAGALAAGLAGILVRSGKYRAGDEERVEPRPTELAEDLAAAAERLIELAG